MKSKTKKVNDIKKRSYNVRVGFTKLKKLKITVDVKYENIIYQRKFDYQDLLEQITSSRYIIPSKKLWLN